MPRSPARSLVVLLSLGLAGCADVAPDALELAAAEAPLDDELELADYALIPDAQHVLPPPSDTPTLRLVTRPSTSDDELCGIDIEASGFPAISGDGRTIVHQLSEVPGNGDQTQHSLTFFAGDTKRRTLIYADAFLDDVDGDCEPLRLAAQAEVDALNTELARSRWRTLERMTTTNDSDYGATTNTLDLHWHAGWFAIRIPGQKVLQREAKPSWRGSELDDEFCSSEPNLRTLWFDRATRRSLVTFDYAGPSCMCDDAEQQDTLVISQAVIDAADEFEYEGC